MSDFRSDHRKYQFVIIKPKDLKKKLIELHGKDASRAREEAYMASLDKIGVSLANGFGTGNNGGPNEGEWLNYDALGWGDRIESKGGKWEVKKSYND